MVDNSNTHVYMNFYKSPESDKITASSHPTRENADLFATPEGGWQVSTKRRIARIRVPVVCVEGQFDL